MENEELEVMTGTIVFLPIGEGSKSDILQPFLYQSRAEIRKIRLEGDISFENASLLEYDGKYCTISGKQGRGDVLLIRDITIMYMETDKTQKEEENGNL